MEGAPSAPASGVNEELQTSTTGPTNAPSSSGNVNNNGGGGGASGQIRARVTVVCQECKRQKLKCDRKNPCGSCVKRNTVERCQYSAAAAEKVDVHSLNNRVTEMEAVMGAYFRGVPLDFTPTYPPAVHAMEERIAAFAAQGGAVNAAPQGTSAQPTDHRHDHHDATKVNAQLFFLSGPVDLARSYGSALCEHAGEPIEEFCRCDGESFAGEEGSTVKEEATSDPEDEDEIMRSTGSSTSISIPTPALSNAKVKRKMSRQAHASSGSLASSARRQNAQAFLPPVSIYYSELTPPAPTAGSPVSNPTGGKTSFPTTEVAPLFYADNPGYVQQQLPQAHAALSTSGPLSIAATPLASSTTFSPMGPPPVPVRSHQEIPSVTLGLLRHLPQPDSGIQLLKNAMNAISCFVMDLGLPGPSSRYVGRNALFKRYQKRFVRTGLSGSSSMASSTGKSVDHALAPRLKGKPKPGGSRKKPVTTYDAPSPSSSDLDATPSSVAVHSRRSAQVRAARGPFLSSPSSPRSSAQPPVPVPASSKSGKSRMRDDVSMSSSDSSPSRNESLPYFALTAALMAVGAFNSPPVRVHKTEPNTKFGTVNHSESPAFLYALSQQALSVWMDDGQPLPAGTKDEQASIKDMRADYLRACLVGVHYLMDSANVDSPNRFCTRSRKHDSPGRRAILSLLGKMVAALRSWGFAEGLLSSSSDSKVEERPDAPATSSKKASSSKSKRDNGKSVRIQTAELDKSANGQNGESEDVRREKEESKIRVLWDVYYYDFVLSDAFGEESLIPASCYSSTPLPSLPPDLNSGEHDSELQHMDDDAHEDQGTSSKDREKAVKEEIQRLRLEQIYLVHRASLTCLASTIKRDMASSCYDHTLDQAVRMENSVKEWMDGLPSELRWAFKHGVESTSSRLVAIGKAVLGDESRRSSRSVDSAPESTAYQSRRRVLSGELALMTQLIVLKIFSPFVSEYLAKRGPAPEPHSSVATALRHLQAPAQAIVHISKLVHDVWELAAQSKRSTFHTPPSLKPPLLGLYPLEQLLLDATLVCSRICCGFVPNEASEDDPGMDRCDPCSSEVMLSIRMGLTLLEHLHGPSQRSHSSSRNSSLSTPRPPSIDMKLLELVRKRWEVKNLTLASPEFLKRDRSTMEAEGEDCDPGSNEGVQFEVSTCRMDVCSEFGGEEAISTSEPQQHSGHLNVDQTQEPLRDSLVAIDDFGSAAINSRVQGIPSALATPSSLATPSPALASSISNKAKKSKEKVPKKSTKHVFRVRGDGSTGQQVLPTKQPPNPPKPLYTSAPREFKDDGTLGTAETRQNEYRYLPAVEHPSPSPAPGMHPPSRPLMLPEIPKSEYDDSSMVDSMSLHLSTAYNSSNPMMGTAPPHYRGEVHVLAPPQIDTTYHHPRHSYTPAPLSPAYGPPSHPQSPSPANAHYFGHHAEVQASSPVYFTEQLMVGHPESSSTGWGQPSDSVQTQPHEQGYLQWMSQQSSNY